MRLKPVFFSIVTLLLLLPVFLTAQKAAAEKPLRPVGIGVTLNDIRTLFAISSATSDLSSTLYIPINLGRGFRLEPEIGFYRFSEEDDFSEDIMSNVHIGIGILPMIYREHYLLYFGGRLAFNFGSIEYKDKDEYYDSSDKRSLFHFSVGPVIGGEYLFTPHLSLGGEAMVRFGYSKEENGSDETIQTFTTVTLVFIRFYF